MFFRVNDMGNRRVRNFDFVAANAMPSKILDISISDGVLFFLWSQTMSRNRQGNACIP